MTQPESNTAGERENKGLPFVCVEVNGQHVIMRGDEHIAWARSKTMGKRIANALNRYEPNERGE